MIQWFLVATVAMSSLHGMAVAMVMKRLDNVVKYHLSATCCVLNSLLSALFFPDQFSFTTVHALSLGLLFAAIYLYERKKFELPEVFRCACTAVAVRTRLTAIL